jgi:pimeloyl-ACP methyl ester carboxylesterase
LRDGDARAALAACRVPIVALASADDPIVPPAMTEMMLADRPDVVLRMLPDGGHLLPVTRPDECAAAVRRLIGLLEQTHTCGDASDPAGATAGRPDGESPSTAPAP